MAKMTYKEHYDEAKVLFTQDIETESNGNTYPSHRITATVMPYSGNTADGNDYAGVKVKIVNQKLTLENGQTVHKKKARGNYVVEDKTETSMKIPEFKEFIKGCNSLLEEIDSEEEIKKNS